MRRQSLNEAGTESKKHALRHAPRPDITTAKMVSLAHTQLHTAATLRGNRLMRQKSKARALT